jgi:hypothetical protein
MGLIQPITIGLKRVSDTIKGFFVRNSSGTEIKIFDTDGNVYVGGTTLGNAVLSGTTKSAVKMTPTASVATTGVNYHKLLTVGDETGTAAYGFGDVAKPTTGVMASFGRTSVATAAITDTGLDARVLNRLTNTGENVLQGAYIKAKNYSTGTVGSLVGLKVEVVSEGTVTNGAVGIELAADGTVLEQDIKFSNGLAFVALTTAITANSTTTSLPAGSLAITSNATGVGHLFTCIAGKWEYALVA